MGKFTSDFYPPRRHLPLVRLAQILAPVWAILAQQIWLEVDTESKKLLTELQGQRLLILPNHPTFQDPVITFLLSGVMGQAYYYLSALELFDSPLASFFQGLGVYSIRRGLSDRPSIAQTIDLLTQPGCHLVIFPEGGCSFQNDTVMPFRSGALQLAMQALNRFAKQGDALPDLYCVPIAIKYRYQNEMQPVIRRTLTRLEQGLKLPVKPMADEYQRLRMISQRVLQQIEQDYELHTPDVLQQPWNQRITRLREEVLSRCEQSLGLPTNPHEGLRERTYRIQDTLKQRQDALESEDAIPTTGLMDYQLLEKSVKRLLNFEAIYDGYVAEKPTSERFLDTLVRLEREVFDVDQPAPKSLRKALLKAGEPVNLKDWFEPYRRDRIATINHLTLKIQQGVQTNLDRLNET